MGILTDTKSKFSATQRDSARDSANSAGPAAAQNPPSSSADVTGPTRIVPTQPPAACSNCHCPAFWQSRSDHLAENLHCLECSPPPIPSMVGARWMVFTPAHQLTGEPEPTWLRVDQRLRPLRRLGADVDGVSCTGSYADEAEIDHPGRDPGKTLDEWFEGLRVPFPVAGHTPGAPGGCSPASGRAG